nr:hypothetical protein [Candidatus Sigynarchaeota archaeon]
MLVIKCAACKTKLFRYLKIGKGEVLRCYNERIVKIYDLVQEGEDSKCPCGNIVGKNKPGYIQMRKGAFFYTGSKL